MSSECLFQNVVRSTRQASWETKGWHSQCEQGLACGGGGRRGLWELPVQRSRWERAGGLAELKTSISVSSPGVCVRMWTATWASPWPVSLSGCLGRRPEMTLGLRSPHFLS